jgi:hypothetical protein
VTVAKRDLLKPGVVLLLCLCIGSGPKTEKQIPRFTDRQRNCTVTEISTQGSRTIVSIVDGSNNEHFSITVVQGLGMSYSPNPISVHIGDILRVRDSTLYDGYDMPWAIFMTSPTTGVVQEAVFPTGAATVTIKQ